jgi:predicted site-specific integrase-resolvase
MKLVDWAKKQGITYLTAWRWFRDGKLPVKAIKTQTGMILVQSEAPTLVESREAWVYSRVSTYAKKDDLERQAQRCCDFCAASGWSVRQVVKEIASGMNDRRPKLIKLLESRPARIVVEHKDRLTRFGFGYFEKLLPMLGCELVVVNRDAEERDDLMKDLVAIITSFCCRLYGLRRGKSKAREIKKEIKCSAPAK